MLRGHKGFDERVGGLGVERQSVAERRKLGALLQESLLQAVPTRMKVLLRRKQTRQAEESAF